MENEHTLVFLFNTNFFIYIFKNKCRNVYINNIKLEIHNKKSKIKKIY